MGTSAVCVHSPVAMDRPQPFPLAARDSDKDSDHAFMKGPKRKRLAKACDACHKSKRRCDGTAPCSNCYFASKTCTYTDASGRPVAAPRPLKQDRPDPQSSADARHQFAHPTNTYPPAGPSSVSDDDDRKNPRKRFRNERGNAVPAEDLFIDGPIVAMSFDRPAPVELDHALTRELTNLFFTHCHPAQAIIHKPTFSAALSHNRVPSYLLHAVCALAAPLSKQPRIRTSPSRFAGKPFAQEALSLMFDGAGRLVCESNLASAQALCLLQIHDGLTNDKNIVWSSRYHDLALQIVENLGVHSPEHPTLTPMPSPEFIHASIEREAIRRIFWLIHFLDVIASIYFKKPITFTDNELRLRLPADETSFELAVHSTLPEYLYLPAVRTRNASEFGHLIRVVSIYAKVEYALDELNGRISADPDTLMNPTATLMEAQMLMDAWAASLPEHLRFSEQSLQVQQSMFETSSNTGAWCYCCMHVYHAACALALNYARQRAQRGPKSEPQWALTTLNMVMTMLGDRAKNSILMGAALWSLIKYCKRDDTQIRAWCADYEEAWGTRMIDIAVEWRPQPSPPLPPLQQYSQPPPPLAQQQHQVQQQPPNLRRQDVRAPQQLIQQQHHNTPPNGAMTGPRPPQLGNPPGGGIGPESSPFLRRSPSNSPPSFRGLDEHRMIRANSVAVNNHSNPNLHNNSGAGINGNSNGGSSSNNNPSPNMGLNQGPGGNVIGGGGGNSGSRHASSHPHSDRDRDRDRDGRVGNGGGTSGPGMGMGMGIGSGGTVVLGPGGNGSGSGGEMIYGPGGAVGGGNGEREREKEKEMARRLVSDSVIDPALQNGGGGQGVGVNGSGAQRGGSGGGLGDGPQSLPSLKASGLLDSWVSSRGDASQKQSPQQTQGGGNGNGAQRSPRRSPPVTMHSGHDLLIDGRSATTTLGMPVGMPWLANESR